MCVLFIKLKSLGFFEISEFVINCGLLAKIAIFWILFVEPGFAGGNRSDILQILYSIYTLNNSLYCIHFNV